MSSPQSCESLDDLDAIDRRISSSSTASSDQVAGRLQRVFSSIVTDIAKGSAETPANESSQQNVNAYRRIMYAHLCCQWQTGTVLGYRRTMHTHLSNQLDAWQTSSSHFQTEDPNVRKRARRDVVLPSPVQKRYHQITIDEAPIPPNSSPAVSQRNIHTDINGQKARPRSVTEPGPRELPFRRSVYG